MPAPTPMAWAVLASTSLQPTPAEIAPGRPFDALLQDMDGDGDLDLLVNRHLAGLVLYERTGDDWAGLNLHRRDDAGLDVPPGIRTPFASAGVADRVEGPAIVAWQPSQPLGHLDLRLRRDGPGPRWLEVRSHDPVEVVSGDAEVERVDATTVRLRLPRRGTVGARLRVDSHTPWLRLSQETRSGRAPRVALDFRIGRDLDRFAGPGLEWWGQDPHGAAWAQVGEGPAPELVVLRGGNVGALQQQGLTKEHLFYRWRGAPDGRYERVPGTIPADSGRARAAGWVDVDADGLPELSLTNRDGANALLVWRPTESGALTRGAFEDRAPALGLDGVCSEVVAWLDLDEDGWEDLVALCPVEGGEAGFRVHRNMGVGAFVEVAGAEVGLPEAGVPFTRRGWLREEHIAVHDLDGDGHLDLLGVALGRDRALRAWCGDGAGTFAPCTERLGLEALTGSWAVRVADLDLDGWSDLVAEGPSPRLLFGGADGFAAFDAADLIVDAPDLDRAVLLPWSDPAGGAPALLVLARSRWVTASPTTPASGGALTVRFDAGDHPLPPGAVLRATWPDGHAAAFRLGSAGRTALSQAVVPLVVGVPAGETAPRLEVQWPGRAEFEPVEAPPDDPGVLRLVVP